MDIEGIANTKSSCRRAMGPVRGAVAHALLNVVRAFFARRFRATFAVAAIAAVSWLMLPPHSGTSAAESLDPFQRQAVQLLSRLTDADGADRQRAAEALGYLRYAPAADSLQRALTDPVPAVRREAALALGWCGGRAALSPLCTALSDDDWTVRQSAWVALTNLTGMQFPFDALADRAIRNQQSAVWRRWVADLQPAAIPPDVLTLLGDLTDEPEENYAAGRPVRVSSCYIGGGALGQTSDAQSITDGNLKTLWMTKGVTFPQSCTIDLGDAVEVGCVVIHQHPPFAMTEYSVEVAVDEDRFVQVAHREQAPSTTQVVTFPAQSVRYLRINSLASRNPTYPTALLQVEARRRHLPETSSPRDYEIERAVRALGALGGEGASEHVIRALRPWLDPSPIDETRFSAKRRVQAAIRALGLLGGRDALEALVTLLQNKQWARYAADALGDIGGQEAAKALLAAYPEYARGLDRPANPRWVHTTDTGNFDPRDRIPAAAYAIAMSLSRIGFDQSDQLEALRTIAPLLVANIPNDADAMMVYDQEPHQQIVAWLLDRVGLRQAVVDAAFEALGQDRQVPEVPEQETLRELARAQLNLELPSKAEDPPYAGNLLAALCRDPADVPLLLNLLESSQPLGADQCDQSIDLYGGTRSCWDVGTEVGRIAARGRLWLFRRTIARHVAGWSGRIQRSSAPIPGSLHHGVGKTGRRRSCPPADRHPV
jgi:hypothetical protein